MATERPLVDALARQHAVDPSRHIVLEASAGTGKTRVLVDRYVNLLAAGIDPRHILAITFTRKAAAEMRARIVARLEERVRLQTFDAGRWRALRTRIADVNISTIDAFCLALLREFPLEADIDPSFDLADDTELPRVTEAALDHALRICRERARHDPDIALAFAQLGERRLRAGLAALLERRSVARAALRRCLRVAPASLTAAAACARAAHELQGAFHRLRGGLEPWLRNGPAHRAEFLLLAEDIRSLCATAAGDAQYAGAEAQARFRVLADGLRGYFLTTAGTPRDGSFRGTGYREADAVSPAAWRRHREAAAEVAGEVARALHHFRADLNAIVGRGVLRMFGQTLDTYEAHLRAASRLDFTGVLERAVALLAGMEEFANSRFRLESRFTHVLVDEFQDTSRQQWALIRQLVAQWGAGSGVATDALAPSMFIVGDRKQSIYGFRDADVSLLGEAAAFIQTLGGGESPTRAIRVSFRSAPDILRFVNAVGRDMARHAPVAPGGGSRRDAFRYDASVDQFPVDRRPEEEVPDEMGADRRRCPALGIIAGDRLAVTADRVAAEIASLLAEPEAVVHDRATGLSRRPTAADVAILFRSRDTHRDFERALSAVGVPSVVYKGRGFFDTAEVQDLVALIRYLADPQSPLRAAAFCRSRIVRLSDRALFICGEHLVEVLQARHPVEHDGRLPAADARVLDQVRHGVRRWRAQADRVPPAALLDLVLTETAYAWELGGRGGQQAHENVKKLRALVRRFQNRGYATLERLADYLALRAEQDESSAPVEAAQAVSLMTVHASKGLEFPVVFVVDLARGAVSGGEVIRLAQDEESDAGADMDDDEAAAQERRLRPPVTVADFQSASDVDAPAREREESKRLLYVALTRARDQLWLSAVVPPPGTPFRPGRGSLAEVLPASLLPLFVQAATTPEGPPLEWVPEPGDRHGLARSRR